MDVEYVREYYNRGKIVKFRLLKWTSFISQFVPIVGVDVMG